jgi:hypothetical protein
LSTSYLTKHVWDKKFLQILTLSPSAIYFDYFIDDLVVSEAITLWLLNLFRVTTYKRDDKVESRSNLPASTLKRFISIGILNNFYN